MQHPEDVLEQFKVANDHFSDLLHLDMESAKLYRDEFLEEYLYLKKMIKELTND